MITFYESYAKPFLLEKFKLAQITFCKKVLVQKGLGLERVLVPGQKFSSRVVEMGKSSPTASATLLRFG